MLGPWDVLKRLNAGDEVERLVGKGATRPDDVGNTVRIPLDVQAHAASARRKQVLVWARPAPDVEHVRDWSGKVRERLREPAYEGTDVKVVVLRDGRVSPSAESRGARQGRRCGAARSSPTTQQLPANAQLRSSKRPAER